MKRTQESKVTELLGKTLVGVKQAGSDDDDEIYFTCDDGSRYRMYHDQDCCENVVIEDVCGDWDDLIGSPLLMAEEAVSENQTPDGVTAPEYPDDSFTWTFYKFATVKGYVTVRWYGESNGYYSESVILERLAKGGER